MLVHGVRPEKFVVCRTKTAALLEPMAQTLGIEIVMIDELETYEIDEYLDHEYIDELVEEEE